jgi:3-mercaptopyruvate sulfurtransferase SseA
LIIDARGSDEFNKISNIDNLPNHIPNSLNVPYNDLFDQANGTIKDKEELLNGKL